METFRFAYEVTNSVTGETLFVWNEGKDESEERAQYHSEDMIQEYYSCLNGWEFRRLSQEEARQYFLAEENERAKFHALLGDIKIDL
jgi:hypothetical protein